MKRALLAASLALAACRATEPDDLGSPFLVSNTSTSPAVRASASSAAGDIRVVYVSLPAGAIPEGLSAIIGNQRSGQSIGVELIDGGMDPTPIPAETGDTLDIVVSLRNGGQERFVVTVPIRARPKVVRTDPGPHKRDVPLNASIVVVFSEPIALGSLSGSALQLTRDGVTIAGQIAFQDSTHTSVRFTPDQTLSPSSDHVLLVTSRIQDLDGDPLEANVTVPFTTAAAPSTGELRVSVTTFGDVLDPNGYVVTIAGETSQVIGLNESLSFQLPAGTYTVYLTGLVNFCFVPGSQTARLTVEGGATTSLSFHVVCPRNDGLMVTVSTAFYGSGWPTLTFLLQVDDGAEQPISPNGYTIISPIAPGTHTVGIKTPKLSGGSFCSGWFLGDGWTRKTVTVDPDGTGRVDFQLACIP